MMGETTSDNGTVPGRGVFFLSMHYEIHDTTHRGIHKSDANTKSLEFITLTFNHMKDSELVSRESSSKTLW